MPADLLVRESASPANWAVRLCVPTVSDAVDNLATPEEFKVAVPREVDPFRNVIVPAGERGLLPFTVAVRARVSPADKVPEETARLVVVASALTTTETASDALERKLEFPEYLAVRRYFPTAREVEGSFARPEESRSAIPRTVEPFRNVTFPASLVAPFACTVALRTNTWPLVTALGVAARTVDVGADFAVTVTVTTPDLLD
jgi:hypothetical protein